MDQTEARKINPEEMVSPEGRREIDDFLSYLTINRVGKRILFEIENYDQCVADTLEMFDKYCPEAVWDVFINYKYPDRPDKYGETSPSGYNLEDHKTEEMRIADLEAGHDAVSVATFGMLIPSYQEMLTERSDQIRGLTEPRAMLIGANTSYSAHEFRDFVRSLNSATEPFVLDYGGYSLSRTDSDIHRIQADATTLPVEDDQFDIIFTNFLLNFIGSSDPNITRGRAIMNMLRESQRTLKSGGVLAMCESDPSGRETNYSVTEALILLEASLRSLNLTDIKPGHAIHYDSHREKKYISESSDEEPRTSKSNIAYSISAEK